MVFGILFGAVEAGVEDKSYGVGPGLGASLDLMRLVAPFVPVEPDVRTEESLPTSVPLSASLNPVRVSGKETIIVGFALKGVVPLVAAVNGSGCNEQTNLASTPAERSNAQKS